VDIAGQAQAEVSQREFDATLHSRGLVPPRRGAVTTLQVNLGKLCNQACTHCHVEAGPTRTEIMEERVADRVIALLAASPSVEVVDLTGGAPELNPNFRSLVEQSRRLGRTVIDRCNLTVLLEPGMDDLPDFLARHEVRITASLPCYGPENVDSQRGTGVFAKSIEAIKLLNSHGYGQERTGLELDLVYNPGGAFLPPPQTALEQRYRAELWEGWGLEFNRLLTLTNLPVKRFATGLARRGELPAYLDLLEHNLNPETLPGLMCRNTVSVGWDGTLFDCDFNQMLEIGLGAGGETRATIFDLDRLDGLVDAAIATGGHCFGCTAGSGSGCGGAIA
jgi:radical SAM/Cys-rich protein